MKRTTYLLKVRVEPDIDEIRAVRAWLKVGLRTFGLRCVEIQESKQQGRMTMDMREFSSGVIRPEDLYDGPRVEKIINVSKKETERYTCAVLEFESGDQLYLWTNQARILNKAWGYNSADFIGQELELSLGHYSDRRTDPPTKKETIDVKPISPSKGTASNGGAPAPALSKAKSGGPDDEIPF